MKRIRKHYIKILGLLFVACALVGCGQVTSAGTQTEATAATVAPYSGKLRTDYTDALSVNDQLALGLLNLEETANAVTADQATKLLPLWESLQSSTAKGDAEQQAIARQIEAALSDAQLDAIVGMQLTQANVQAWLQEQGPAMGGNFQPPAGGNQTTGDGFAGGQMPEGWQMPEGGFSGRGGNMTEEERSAMRERFQNMSEEERANMQAQFGQRNGGATGGAGATGNRSSAMLQRAVVALLTERSGQAKATEVQPSQAATATTTAATAEIEATPTATPIAIVTLPPMRTPTTPTATPTPTPKATPQAVATSAATPKAAATIQPAAATTPAPAETTTATSSGTTSAAPLTQVPDTDPGPPLVIEITTNYAEADPNLEGSVIYTIGGVVRNPTDQEYVVTAVHVTFYDADGFRGAFYAFTPRPGQRGIRGEWHWHGAIDAEIVCNLLGPGESCPFTASITGQNMATFHVHPDAVVAEWHEASPVTLSDSKASDTGAGYVRITGTATNPNVYPIKNIVISGALLDANGQMLSLGTAVVPSLEAGASAQFEVYVEKKAYVNYQLYARAEQSN
ncbi:MAG: hypothetical protein JXA21_00935 [Anaerolineae bacterium]|nr:hypothetical protein [Anaerolineae bacterium]